MADSRAISSELKNMFYLPEGVFYPFYLHVKNHTEQLAVCFRGNGTPEKISIYHNNHIVWDLYEDGSGPKVAMSFNHARYCEDWEEKRDELGNLGFDIYDKAGEPISTREADTIGMLVCDCNGTKYSRDPYGFVIKSYGVIMDIMRIFFQPKQNEDFDYFKQSFTKYKKNLAEKRWQQWIFNRLKNSYNGLFAYDLEFAQPGAQGEDNTNEPDMLAVRYEEGTPVAIVLLEIKSLFSACKPRKKKNGAKSSDIYEHIKGMKKYSQSDNVQSRRKDAYKILNDYYDMGLYVKHGQIIPPENNNLPVECAIMFTTADLVDIGYLVNSAESAIHYYLTYKDEIDEICKPINEEWHCEIYKVGEFVKNRKYPTCIYTLPGDWK